MTTVVVKDANELDKKIPRDLIIIYQGKPYATKAALEWKAMHRSEEDMNRLFAASAFKRPCTQIRWEDQRIGLLAECVKS